MDTLQSLEQQCRQALELQTRVDASLSPDGIRNSQLISAVVEGIIPVIKKHVFREIAKRTDHLKRRVTMLEINHRARKVRPVKVIERRRRVKCMF
jgi:hypothetical protein